MITRKEFLQYDKKTDSFIKELRKLLKNYKASILCHPLANIDELFKSAPWTIIFEEYPASVTELKNQGIINEDTIFNKEWLEEIEDDTHKTK